MELSNTMQIVQSILGNENFKKLIHEVVEEYSDRNLFLKEIEPILETYCIAILLIGFSKKSVEIEKCKIALSNNENIFIKSEDVCKKYGDYIQKIEDSKFELLRKII